MNAVDVFMWIVIGGAILLIFGFFIWSLFEIAGLSDEISEEQYKEFCRSNGFEEGDYIGQI